MRDLRWGVAVVPPPVEALTLTLRVATYDGGPLDWACDADGLRSWSAQPRRGRGGPWTWAGSLAWSWAGSRAWSPGTLTGLGCYLGWASSARFAASSLGLLGFDVAGDCV